MDYKLYTSYSSKVVSESYKGHIINNNKSIYLKIHNTEFLQTSSRSIKINHDQKMVAVFNKPDIESNVNPMSLSILLKNYKTQDLIDKGVPKGIRLKELCNIIADEFYREPRHKEELLIWAKEQGLI